MQLTISERLNLLGILPAQGNLLTIKELRVMREALAPNETERNALNIRVEGDQIHWDNEGDPVDVTLSLMQCEIAKKALHDLDAREQMTEPLLPLWDKFCG